VSAIFINDADNMKKTTKFLFIIKFLFNYCFNNFKIFNIILNYLIFNKFSLIFAKYNFI
jgi:hypothetical protein